MSSCCQYLPATACGSTGGQPDIYVSKRQVLRLSADGKVFKYFDEHGKKCWIIDADATPVCSLPPGSLVVSLKGVTLYVDCTACNADTGGHPATRPGFNGGGSGGGGGGGGGGIGGGGGTLPYPGNPSTDGVKWYEGTPCDGNPDAPEVWGTPTAELANGTYIDPYLEWCYSFDVDGSGTTTPPSGKKYIFIWDSGISDCSNCTDGIPCDYCDNQALGFRSPPLYVQKSQLADFPDPAIWEWNGECVEYDPTIDPELIPPNAQRVSPRVDYDDCSSCTSGVHATLCPDQINSEDAPVLWIRDTYLPDIACADFFRGFYYLIDPTAPKEPKGADDVAYVPVCAYADCGDAKCHISDQRGVLWHVCADDPRAHLAKPRYTKATSLPVDVIRREIDGICRWLDPTDPIVYAPPGASFIIPFDEFPNGNCATCINARGGDGEPPSSEDMQSDDSDGGGDGGGGGGGGSVDPPHRPPDKKPPKSDPRPYRKVQDCDDPTNFAYVDRRTLGYIETGYVVAANDKCWKIIGNPLADPGSPLISGKVYMSCSHCKQTKHCWVKWQFVYDCDADPPAWGSPTIVSKVCRYNDQAPGIDGQYVVDPGDATGRTAYVWIKGAECSVDGDCADGAIPSSPGFSPSCLGCGCPESYCVTFTVDNLTVFGGGDTTPFSAETTVTTTDCVTWNGVGGSGDYTWNVVMGGSGGTNWFITFTGDFTSSGPSGVHTGDDLDCPPTSGWTTDGGLPGESLDSVVEGDC